MNKKIVWIKVSTALIGKRMVTVRMNMQHTWKRIVPRAVIIAMATSRYFQNFHFGDKIPKHFRVFVANHNQFKKNVIKRIKSKIEILDMRFLCKHIRCILYEFSLTFSRMMLNVLNNSTAWSKYIKFSFEFWSLCKQNLAILLNCISHILSKIWFLA